MTKLYMTGIQILHWFENTKEPISENQYLTQIHGIIDSIQSYMFAQAKKQNYGVFWKIGVMWKFKIQPVHTQIFFFVWQWMR